MTLHPELVLPEPSDPTLLLLRASEVTKLSEVLRTKAKANALFVEGTIDALAPMGKEQDDARGNFPGPLPVIYSPVSEGSLTESLNQLQSVDGVEGVLITFFGGTQIKSVDHYLKEVENHPTLTDRCLAVWDAGLQPIPEIVLDSGSEWLETDVVQLVDAVKDTCGGLDPVSIVFTEGQAAETEDSDGEPSTPKLTIPSSVSKRTTFIGSIRTTAGDGRMNAALNQVTSCNFNGAFLRADCVPGYRLNPDLNAVGGFWSAVTGDLKSLKSKNFSFRSKVKIENDVPMQWYNYQKDIMDSGALGSPTTGGSDGLNTDAGDYKGF